MLPTFQPGISTAPIEPSLSVVTVVLNGMAHLEQCLESVANQQGVSVEHIVIDGGSNDGSVELLKRWSDRLAFWSSEPDAGISDAMNRGLQRAQGEWILFLHADDYLPESTVLMRAALKLDNAIDVAAFPVLFGTPPQLHEVAPRPAGVLLNFKLGMCHQGVLTRRALFLRLGDHDVGYKIAMDYDFFLRAYRSGARISSISSPTLAVMRDMGLSSRTDWPSLRRRFAEERRIHFAHSKGRAQSLFYCVYWAVYLPYRRLREVLRR